MTTKDEDDFKEALVIEKEDEWRVVLT